jgi:hypothetical protein
MLSKLSEIRDGISLYVEQHQTWFVCALMLIPLAIHFIGKREYIFTALALLLTVVAVFGFVAFYLENSAPIGVVLLFLIVYSVGLYIVLCDVLLYGLAKWLTKKRGEKWVKELDYFYLMLGAVGIVGSLNKIEFITGRYSKYDIIAPLILATAVVIRFIRTRAEIGGWNKPTSQQA